LAVFLLLFAAGMYLSGGNSGSRDPSTEATEAGGAPAPARTQTAETAEDAGSSGTPAASISTVDIEESDPALQEEAASYVSELAKTSEEPVKMEQAETFVGAGQPLTAAASDEPPAGEMAPGETPAVASTETADALREGENADTPSPAESDASAAQAQSVEETGDGPPESAAGDQAADTAPATPAGPAAGEVEVDLPLTEDAPVTIAELLGPAEDIPPDAVYYVHTVKPGNDQGIWGIVHTGIIDNFAHGVAIHRGESDETYRVDIPRDADERREDESSSFLGKFIYEKSRQSYVYNFRTERLGRNPDLIVPGQEIVIISFTPEELIAVYKHFARQQAKDS
jgi:hypothetical protein